MPHLEQYHGTDTFLTEALTIEANARVAEAVDADQPFFLYFAHYAVHAPFHSDSRFAEHYANSGQSPQAQAFATLIEGMDKSLGDVLDQIASLGVAEDTVIFFLGDNGSDAPLGHQHAVACAAPLRGKKGAHYEGGMRVPFIVSWAKLNPDNEHQQKLVIPADQINNQVASVNDLFPTIQRLAGFEAPADHIVDGRDLSKLLTGHKDDSREQAFLMHYPHSPHRSTYFTSLRIGDWKVVYHFIPSEDSEDLRYQLFNLADDTFESTNLASDQPEKLHDMMVELSERLKAHDALYPVTETDGTIAMMPIIP